MIIGTGYSEDQTRLIVTHEWTCHCCRRDNVWRRMVDVEKARQSRYLPSFQDNYQHDLEKISMCEECDSLHAHLEDKQW